jgi:glycerate kinase
LAGIVDLESKISGCDLVITAEGRLDDQSLVGKATGELIKLCRRYGKPLWAVPAVSQSNIDWRQHGIEIVSDAARPGGPATANSVADVVANLLCRQD